MDGSPQVVRFNATTYGTLCRRVGAVHSIRLDRGGRSRTITHLRFPKAAVRDQTVIRHFVPLADKDSRPASPPAGASFGPSLAIRPFHLSQDLVDAEARRLLPRREVPE